MDKITYYEFLISEENELINKLTKILVSTPDTSTRQVITHKINLLYASINDLNFEIYIEEQDR